MPVSQSELTVARSWIGNTEEESVFNERFDRLLPDAEDRDQALGMAIEESLRAQLNAMVLDQPATFSVPGVSASYGENIRTLKENLESFIATGMSVAPGAGAAQIVTLDRGPLR
jgi:hypothetical protein